MSAVSGSELQVVYPTIIISSAHASIIKAESSPTTFNCPEQHSALHAYTEECSARIQPHFRDVVKPLLARSKASLDAHAVWAKVSNDLSQKVRASKLANYYENYSMAMRIKKLAEDRREFQTKLAEYNQAVTELKAAADAQFALDRTYNHDLTDAGVQETDEFKLMCKTIAFDHRNKMMEHTLPTGQVVKTTAYKLETSGPNPKSPEEITESYRVKALATFREKYK